MPQNCAIFVAKFNDIAKMEVKFKEVPMWQSQQTIVKILKQVKYRFEPLNEYENNEFICVTEQKARRGPLKELMASMGAKVKDKYDFCPLTLTICGEYGSIVETMVFTREDVKRIISDVPEHYIGDMEI